MASVPGVEDTDGASGVVEGVAGVEEEGGGFCLADSCGQRQGGGGVQGLEGWCCLTEA